MLRIILADKNGGTRWTSPRALTLYALLHMTCAVHDLPNSVPSSRFHFPLKGRQPMKHAIITSFLGKLRDRFCEYQEPLSIEQKLERMTRIPGVSGAEMVHPYEVDTAEVMRSHLRRLKLEMGSHD